MPEQRNGLDWFSKNLIEILPAAVYVCDKDAVIAAYNRRAAELWGRAPKVGDTDEKFCGAHRLYRPDGTYLPHNETPMEWVLRTGGHARDQEVVIERPDGSRVTVLVNISPVFDEDGAQIGAVNCFQDLSTQKQSERERTRMLEELQQSQKLNAMGQIIGNIAHDFNNLLTPILGSLDVLHGRAAGTPPERRMIDGALQSAQRAKALVQRLLAFARRQPLQTCAVDAAALVGGMADLIRSSIGPNIAMKIACAAGMPAAKADPQQIETAILNLVVNARDAMPKGGTITIKVDSETIKAGHPAALPPGRYIGLSICDTGAGMDGATMARAIEPFFSTKGAGKGTGLGLSTVHGLMSQLGGALILESQSGVGTEARMLLPVSDEPVSVPEVADVSVPTGKRVGRLLLVDDDPSVRAVTNDMLVELGYEVVEAASANEAITVLERGLDFDGIITDHLMPGMTGADFARVVHRRNSTTPVLILSGYSDVNCLATGLPLLAKPFRRSDLETSLSGLLSTARNR